MANNSLLGSFGDLSNSGLMFRNRIINGNFDIWQRGTSFTPANGDFVADRYRIFFDGSAATRTISRQTFTVGQTDVPNNPKYFMRFAQSVAGTGGTYNLFTHRVEYVSTLSGQQVVLSFYAKAASSTSLSLQAVQNFGTSGSPSSTVVTSLGSLTIGTSWQRYSVRVILPSISGKTLGTDNNDYVGFDFLLPVNATFTFDIAQVQLEGGPVATPFEMRPVGTELALCQRYYQKIKISSNTYLGTVGYASNIWGQTLSMPTMRKVPLGTSGGETIMWVIPGSTIHTTTKGTDISVGATENTFFIIQSVTSASSGISNGAQYCFEVGNASSLSINLDAEL